MKQSLFKTPNQRLIVAADYRPPQNENPVPSTQRFLEKMVDELEGLGVTFKLNTIARILGTRSLELLNDNDIGCFLDLKLFDIGNTLMNDVSWIQFYKPLIVTVAERVKPEAFKRIMTTLDETLVLPVGPLTDLDDADFKHFQLANRQTEVRAFFKRVWQLRAHGAICAPTDIALAPEGFRSDATFVTPAVKPEWSLEDDNSENALTPARAIKAGADAIVVGRGITAAANMRDAAKRTIDEIALALS